MLSYDGYSKSTDKPRSLSDELMSGYSNVTSGGTNAPSMSMKGGYEANADNMGIVKALDIAQQGAGLTGMGGGVSGLLSSMNGGSDYNKLLSQYNAFQKQPTIQNSYDMGTPADIAGRRKIQQFLMQQQSQLQPYMKYPSFGGI